MNLTKCPNGHYYDANRYGNNCPHCAAATLVGDGSQPTTPLTAMNYTTAATEIPDTEFTASITPAVSAVTMPVVQPVQPAQTIRSGATVTGSLQDDQQTIGIQIQSQNQVTGVDPVVGWLVCVGGVNLGRDYRLHPGRNFVGRAAGMDVCLAGDNSVSRDAQAVVVYDPKSNLFLIQPGDAKELLYVNEQLLLSTNQLKAYDKLSLGKTELLFIPLCSDEYTWGM